MNRTRKYRIDTCQILNILVTFPRSPKIKNKINIKKIQKNLFKFLNLRDCQDSHKGNHIAFPNRQPNILEYQRDIS